MSNHCCSKMANSKGKKGHLELYSLASDIYFFIKEVDVLYKYINSFQVGSVLLTTLSWQG